MKISAVLLAGGQSRRFGRDKALFPWHGIPLGEHQLSTLREAGAEEIIISARTDPSWRPPDLQFVADAQPACGPIGGLSSALSVMKGSHLLALAIDMPFMTPDYLRSLIALVTPGCGIVPVLDDEPEPLAAVYPRAAAETVLAMIAEGSDLALRGLIAKLLHVDMIRPRVVSANEVSLFQNINHPLDARTTSQIP